MSIDLPGTAKRIYESLSPAQREIVTADPDDNLLVLAPPGTGKTHTVVARIKYLIEEAGLEPQELLVLCFTRAAVGEIMQRIRHLIQASEVHDDLRFVSVRTFDSYATGLLLSEKENEIDLSDADYDSRIRMAVENLSDYESSAASIVSDCRHLIVDELQDVVSVRAELVRAILRLAGCGFTLLGDPAQAIYGFTASEEETVIIPGTAADGSEDLITWVRSQKWPGGLRLVELADNYRSTDRLDRIGRVARDTVLSPMSDEKVYQALTELIGSITDSLSGRSPNPQLSNPEYNSVCILCRTNGELLQIADLLARHNIPHYMRPRSTEYALPPWIGRVLGPAPSRQLSLPDFERLWNSEIGAGSEVDPEQAFRWLKRVEAGDRPTLDIEHLHRRLYRGQRLPDDADAALTGVHGPLSLSTIHSAKGREFDHVIVLTPDGKAAGASGNGWREEARVLYVAATRARELLSRMEREGLYGNMWVATLSNGRRRWVSRSNAYHMEVGLPDDVDALSFVSTYLYPHRGDVRRIQHMLWSEVRPGTELYIEKQIVGGHAFFRIAAHRDSGLEGLPFAQFSLAFKNDLKELINRYSGRSDISYPNYWTGVRVTRIVTELLPPFPENVYEPFSRTGFCLGIQLRGLIRISS